ncbi:MAG: histidine phosphatase family protein [Betaproteobacteria bacterium]|nr:MAG: histidine phosphatase family protein [Betaproteobacteria bacterium]
MRSLLETQLLAIRHGETEWNCQGRFQGHLNSELNLAGLAQANALGTRFTAERFDLLLSSDLGRALQTAEAIARHTGHSILVEPGLRERNMGIFQGLTPAGAQARYPDEYTRFARRDPDYAIPDGESMRQFFERCVACFAELATRHAGLTLTAVTHGGVLAMLYRHARAMPLEAQRDFPLHNTGVNRFRHRQGAWQLESWGEIGHLGHAPDDPE